MAATDKATQMTYQQKKAKAKKEPAKPISLYAEAWRKLSRIDVADHIVTKGDRVKLDYLPWPWAWAQLMQHYPESLPGYWEVPRDDGTIMLYCSITIRDGEREATRVMHLPVMDHMNKAISNPDARAISDSMQRTLVKCLALFGLGLDLYAKSDMPVGTWDDPISLEQRALLTGLIEKAKADEGKFLDWLGVSLLMDIPAHRYKRAREELERKIKLQSKK